MNDRQLTVLAGLNRLPGGTGSATDVAREIAAAGLRGGEWCIVGPVRHRVQGRLHDCEGVRVVPHATRAKVFAVLAALERLGVVQRSKSVSSNFVVNEEYREKG